MTRMERNLLDLPEGSAAAGQAGKRVEVLNRIFNTWAKAWFWQIELFVQREIPRMTTFSNSGEETPAVEPTENEESILVAVFFQERPKSPNLDRPQELNVFLLFAGPAIS